MSVACGGFVSCSDDDDDMKIFDVTVASVERVYSGSDFSFNPYFAKKKDDKSWGTIDIQGFEHEEGYEYVLKIKQERHPCRDMADAPMYIYTLLETLSKTKKESENIPMQVVQACIASKRPLGAANPSYYVRIRGEWDVYEGEIEGLEYEEGYEYQVFLGLTFLGHDAVPKYDYSLIHLFEKKQKESEGLPVE